MSYLNLDDDMYLVYDFKQDMTNRRTKEYIENTRLLSLNDESIFGIKKDKGLFASDEWWANIDSGQIITRSVSGVISSIDLLRKYSSHRINQSCNQIYP